MPFSPVLAYYLHNFSPYVFRIGESFGPHWYGLAYVLGFYCCYLMLVHLARKGYSELKAEQAGDFITYLALFGVVLGGRVGYMLLYNFDGFLKDPTSIVKLWDGGMASHGGIAGIALFTLYWSWKHKISWTNLGDNIVVGAPIGILFGRLANFINGELYGRVTDVSWAMKFPTEIHNQDFIPAVENSLNFRALPQYSNEIIAAVKTMPNGVQELEAILHPRHPSQLYEAFLEGLFLTVVLYLVRTRVKNLPNGVLTGLFFILYAGVRIFGEQYREPDADLIMGITRGQFYSLFMILIGLAFLGWALRGKSKAASAK
ncbi:prolipoprotein diacylglyceryl transferase [soil metagenome]